MIPPRTEPIRFDPRAFSMDLVWLKVIAKITPAKKSGMAWEMLASMIR